MSLELLGLLIVLAIVLGAEFVNGRTDAPNAIAIAVMTRTLSFPAAVLIACVMNAIGALCGTAVAATVGKGIVTPDAINLLTIAAALIGPIIWALVAARIGGIPVSKSHGMLGGFAGAALATAGPAALLVDGWIKVGIGLVGAILLGGASGWILTKIIRLCAHRMEFSAGKQRFDKLLIFASAFLAFNHGQNDGQKYIGMFTLTLVMGGVLPVFDIPWWVTILCAVTMGLGTACCDRKIILTVGKKISDIESWQGAAAILGASGTIALASNFGVPISTTHAIVSARTGAGAAKSPALVRWQHPRTIVYAAILTFPICAGVAAIVCYLFQFAARLLA